MRSNSVQYRCETRRESTLSRSRNGRNGFVEADPVCLQWVTVRRKTDTYHYILITNFCVLIIIYS